MPKDDELGAQEQRMLALFRKIRIRSYATLQYNDHFASLSRKIDAGTATVYEIADFLELLNEGNALVRKATALLRKQFSNLRSDYTEFLSDYTQDKSLEEIRAALDILEG